MLTEEDDILYFTIDLKNIKDSELVALRNRVVWECKRRINMGIDIEGYDEMANKKSSKRKDPFADIKKEYQQLHERLKNLKLSFSLKDILTNVKK